MPTAISCPERASPPISTAQSYIPLPPSTAYTAKVFKSVMLSWFGPRMSPKFLLPSAALFRDGAKWTKAVGNRRRGLVGGSGAHEVDH